MHAIGKVVIGYNEGWKQAINLGKVTNQKFVAIPHAQIIAQLQYKLGELGIKVIVREESYTSQASALDNDPIPTHGECEQRPVFSGKRKYRGLYQSPRGCVNADVNGALNIMRKATGEALLPACRGVVCTPARWNLARTRIRPARRGEAAHPEGA